ncbi:MAG TPA: hypothetical protein VF424_13995 [Vicinamibacterales bacterium]
MEGLFTACRPEFFFGVHPRKLRRSPGLAAASRSLSLAARQHIIRITHASSARRAMPLNTIRFNEIINGRPYVIEALSLGQDRWRAQLVRTSGGTTALMPFYGATPDEAARHLTDWLTRAAAALKSMGNGQ